MVQVVQTPSRRKPSRASGVARLQRRVCGRSRLTGFLKVRVGHSVPEMKSGKVILRIAAGEKALFLLIFLPVVSVQRLGRRANRAERCRGPTISCMMSFASVEDIGGYTRLLSENGCEVLVAEDTKRFPVPHGSVPEDDRNAAYL